VQRLANRWQKVQRRTERWREHVGYRHKVCPQCGAVQDGAARRCSSCQARLPHRRWVVLERIGVTAPQLISVSSLLGALCALAYVRLVIAGEGSPLSFDWVVLYQHGGNYPPAVAGGDYWRPLTAVFLHAGIWHLGFNLFALAVVGPHIEDEYGPSTTAALFVATGVIASLGSAWAGLNGVGIGASGAIMGLIGAAAASGHRAGTTAGRELRNDMLKWTVYVVIIGFAIGADNRAHLFGFASGASFGLLVRPAALTRPRWGRPMQLAGLGAVALAVAATVATWSPPRSRYEAELTAKMGPALAARWTAIASACAGDDRDACAAIDRRAGQCRYPITDMIERPSPEERVLWRVECEQVGLIGEGR
jgi:membrane associated rhomboid family serine protease